MTGIFARSNLYLTPRRAAVLSGAYVALWLVSLVLVRTSATATNLGRLGLFLIGLAWVIWLVERSVQRRERPRLEETARRLRALGPEHPVPFSAIPTLRTWNPLDLGAWYYGDTAQRLKQSLLVLTCYAVSFLAVFFLIDWFNFSRGGGLDYELPAGGGGDGREGNAPVVIQQPAVQVKKVVRKKFVINPYSGILFNAPPIDKFDPKLIELTKEEYTVGQGLGQGIGAGSGSGAGFGSGSATGKVGLVRLQYEGGDWDLNFGPGKDQNMLREYGVRTQQKIAEKTEAATLGQIARTTDPKKLPALLLVGGQRNIFLSKSEKQILRDYLIEKRGMLFGDNGGSMTFHNAFFSLMHEVTGVTEVPVPLDDILHRSPYRVPYLPYVSPHGGKIAYGWKVDGRWVGFYHPGDIGDAWADGHAGVPVEIWEACYRLGVNVMFYANLERNKWLESQKKP